MRNILISGVVCLQIKIRVVGEIVEKSSVSGDMHSGMVNDATEKLS